MLDGSKNSDVEDDEEDGDSSSNDVEDDEEGDSSNDDVEDEGEARNNDVDEEEERLESRSAVDELRRRAASAVDEKKANVELGTSPTVAVDEEVGLVSAVDESLGTGSLLLDPEEDSILIFQRKKHSNKKEQEIAEIQENRTWWRFTRKKVN